MDSSIDSLTGMPMPALGPSPSTGARPNARAEATGAGGFERLMGLQQRGRMLEAKLKQQATGANAQDPARTANAQQQAFYAKEFEAIRELVGPAPGGNARRALASVLERLEGGGELRPTDRARVRLAIAADDKRVDMAGATRMRTAILSLDEAFQSTTRAAEDPTMIQDPARLATFRAKHENVQQQMRDLEKLIDAGTFDARSVDAVLSTS